MGLHLVYEAPPEAGFVVGDLRIGAQPIRFGGQLAENIHVGLFALVSHAGQFHNQAFTCNAVPTHPLDSGLVERRPAGLPTRARQG
jgi:hypothetical protein